MNRYSRQILFQPIGEDGQKKIRAASICVVGLGALGSFQAEALTRAGIGRLRLIDRDYVDFSNLQRQWLYTESDASDESPKAIAAERRLKAINSDVEIEALVTDFAPSNAEDLGSGFDLILDGSDNFETRYLLNDISVKLNTPWIYGAAIGSYGIVLPVVPGSGPCFTCIYPEKPAGIQPTCDTSGILASTTASVAALQVSLSLKLLVATVEPAIYTLDIWDGIFRQLPAGERDPECPTCSYRSFDFLDGKNGSPVSLCGRNAVQLHAFRPLSLTDLAERLRPLGEVKLNDFALRMSFSKYDLTVFPDGRAIVKGTTDVAIAKSLYARLIGA